MVHRNARPDDAHLGKYNGLGGKLDPGEDVIAGLRREIREEAGIECDAVRLAGTVSWPGFGKGGEDWFGFIFRVDRFTGTPLESNPEGTLEWVEIERVSSLPLWEGDRFFLPMLFDHTHPQFHGVMPYRDGKPVSWSYSTVGPITCHVPAS
jgi:8-oxo-dGTP diphosphatase